MRDTIQSAPDGAPRGAPGRAPRAWWAVLLLSLLVAAYGACFVARGEASFPGELAASFRARPWRVFGHAAFGTLALLVGPLQFRRDLLARRRRLHRLLGRVYVGAALGTGATGLLMAPDSAGGPAAHLGFGLLAVLMLATTGVALERIRAGDVAAHRAWMLRGFALMFAGVTLRLELPLLVAAHGGAFEPAYRWVAWLCWVPNLVWAERHVRRSRGAAPLPVPAGRIVKLTRHPAVPRSRAS
jgi:uncharacterized membrane protein